ncbi:MAG: ABC transporter ATP-binding protein/permease, partial [Variibacter sp.]|nr:ABC transporter ATP-binding protein/permease [Variibacter sp.]
MNRVPSVVRTFLSVAVPFFNSEERWVARGLLFGVIVAELALVMVAISVIRWNARFFNALEARDWEGFTAELTVFAAIAVGAIVCGTAQFYFGQMFQIRWRRWLTENYLSVWMAQGRHYRVRFVDQSVDNIHLRIANDVYLFIQHTHGLGTGLLGSFVALASFAYILWGLSATTPLPLFGVDLSFPGYLIWIAMAYAVIGTLAAHLIGWRLIPLNFNQQRFESDFRFAIVRAADHSEPIALMGGEAVERAELGARFGNLLRNWTTLVNVQSKLTAFVAGYGHISTVFPTLVVSPAYLTGAITLGTLMQAQLAFQRVEGAFAFFIGAYGRFAEWKAVLDRLAQYKAAMVKVDESARQHDGVVAVVRGEDEA